jgi:flagellar biosynthesis component FlhA
MTKAFKVGVLGGAVTLGLMAFLPMPTMLIDFYEGLMFAFSAIVALLCVIATVMIEHESKISGPSSD